jgi:hypothetical protein
MKKLASAAAIGLLVAAPAALDRALAQTAAQPEIVIMKVDTVKLAHAYRGSKVIGATVKNNADETIGKVDDIIIRPDDSVGGFLGIGDKLVVVPYEQLKFEADNKLVLPGGTKDGLKALPEFKYRAG